MVAYALKGTVRADLVHEPIGIGSNGEPVFLKDMAVERRDPFAD